jgi:translation initiation factor 1A
MVQKKGKGKKGKNSNKRKGEVAQRELIFREDGQDYVRITSMLGDRRIRAVTTDNTDVLAIIPGRFRKKRCDRMGVGDVILVSHRDFQADKHDVIYKYNRDEVTRLRGYDEIPASFLSTETAGDDADEDDGFIFGDDTDEEITFEDEDIDDI